MFELYANKTKLTVNSKEILTSGSVNVFTVHFTFSDDWDGFQKTAVFKVGNDSWSVKVNFETDDCIIPNEALEKPKRPLMIGIYGQNAETGATLPTIWADAGTIREGTTVDGATEIVPPTGNIDQETLDDIYAKIAKKGDAVNYNGMDLELLSDGEVISSTPIIISGGNTGGDNGDEPGQDVIPGVMSFNNRTGRVMPQDGDYTAEMVGALPDDYEFAETDPTVPDWAKQPEKPTYTAEEVGADPAGSADSVKQELSTQIQEVEESAKSDRQQIKSEVDDLTTRIDSIDSDIDSLDSDLEILEAQIESKIDETKAQELIDSAVQASETAVRGDVNTALGQVQDLIPTAVSELENDKGYITSGEADTKIATAIAGIEGGDGVVGPQGPPGQDGQPGKDGQDAGFGTITATVDESTGTPNVIVEATGPNTAKDITFNFTGLKGEPGQDGEDGKDGLPGIPGEPGESAGFGTINATVDDTTGEPSVTVSTDGPDTAKNITFNFSGLKGKDGQPGADGLPGVSGKDGTTFTPSVSEDGVLSWSNADGKENPPEANIKGPQGEAGTDGLPGQPGFSPTVSTSPMEDGQGTTVTITDGEGPHEFNVLNGKDGEPGSDYILTEEDKQEIAGMVEVSGDTNITVDDTLNLSEENVLSVSTPVNGIISKKEFEALEPEKKNKGMYIIPGSSIGASIGGNGLPTGSILSFMGKTAPDGYLTCDGSEYQIEDYPKLADFFEEQFGEKNHFGGNGESTFCVPNMLGKFALNASEQYNVGTTGGASTVKLNTNEIPAHTHYLRMLTTGTGNTNTDKAAGVAIYTGGSILDGYTIDRATTGKYKSSSIVIEETGNSIAHENMPPYMAVIYCIKT